MRIAIIGNSHVASVMVGWRDIVQPKHPDVELTFLAAKGRGLRTLRADGSRLVSDSEAARTEFRSTLGREDPDLDTADLDAVVIHGLYSPIGLLVRAGMLTEHVERRHRFVSQGLIGEIGRQWWHDSLWFAVAPEVRKATRLPIFVTPQPLVASTVLEHRDRHTGSDAIASADGGPGMSLRRVAENARQEFAKELDQVLLPQPETTVYERYFTDEAYSREATRLTGDMDKTYQPLDVTHMNRDYGAAVLDDLLPFVADHLARSS